MPDKEEIDLDFDDTPDPGAVLPRFLATLGKSMRPRYTDWRHTTGKKRGQSLYSHILDLVTFAARLAPVLGLSADEMALTYVALVVHDLNKLGEYSAGEEGKILKYVDAATPEHIATELEAIGAEAFLPGWRVWLDDIVWLAHGHQVAATGSARMFDQRAIDRTATGGGRLRILRALIQAADVADNAHAGDPFTPQAAHLRDRILDHVNTTLTYAGREPQYRFAGHRLAELRGIFTNVLHNTIVAELRERFGAEGCIDALYFPDGIDYLIDRRIAPAWDDALIRAIAARAWRRIAEIQAEELAQFIKARPIGIVVDDAALASGASEEDLFTTILLTVERKRYRADWREERERLIRQDWEKAGTEDALAMARPLIATILEAPILLPADDDGLRRGEFVGAYRKFLEDHRAAELKQHQDDSWRRVYRLFDLPAERWPIFDRIDAFRRSYALARDLPLLSLEAMRERVLADLERLARPPGAPAVVTAAAGAAVAEDAGQAILEAQPDVASVTNDVTPSAATTSRQGASELSAGAIAIADYLRRHLQFWNSAEISTATLPNFADTLRRYAARKPYQTCGTCGSPLEAEEWMAAQVPPNINVQFFSNRLEGGAGEPKRNVCAICRTQYILEKLAWRGHRDKQGSEQVTYYLHLFPFAFFTAPLLEAWWQGVARLRDSDHQAFFLDTRKYYRDLFTSVATPLAGRRTATNGMGLPRSMLTETFSATPVVPIVAPGENDGMRFMLALEHAVALARWFECRILMTRSPVPPLNLAHVQEDEVPVVLFIEGVPRNLAWLIPTPTLNPAEMERLTKKLAGLHQLARQLDPGGKEGADAIPHDLAVAAVDDPLALYYTADRLIERKVAARKARGGVPPEMQALTLSREVAGKLDKLMRL